MRSHVLVATRALLRFIGDEEGQDLVEYALLGVFVALATIAGLRVLETSIASAYNRWDTDEQNIWQPPSP